MYTAGNGWDILFWGLYQVILCAWYGFYEFWEILSAFVGWFGEIFWFNPNMQNSEMRLTLALPSPHTVIIKLTTFW